MVYEAERLVIPFRTKTNRRMFSQNDIKRLQFIQFLTRKRGVNLAGVKILLELIREGKDSNLDVEKVIYAEWIIHTLSPSYDDHFNKLFNRI